MPRIARVCAPNYPHHISQRGNNRQQVFFSDADRKIFLRLLRLNCSKWEIDIWAYCLMDNHFHLLAVPRKDHSLARGIGSVDLFYTQYINRKHHRKGRLWQNRFFSTIVEQEAYLWAASRYIERNPVRAGLVKKAEDYPWSSARAHVLDTQDNLLSDEGWLDRRDRKGYREFLRHEDKKMEKSLRKATSTGRPLGRESFVKGLEEILGMNLSPKSAGRPTKNES